MLEQATENNCGNGGETFVRFNCGGGGPLDTSQLIDDKKKKKEKKVIIRIERRTHSCQLAEQLSDVN